jgi:hypothetical protein
MGGRKVFPPEADISKVLNENSLLLIFSKALVFGIAD